MPRVVTCGEALGVLRADEQLEHAAALRVGTGGAELNVAIGLARLGVDVTWFGRVGNDAVGRRIARELRAEGVDARVVIDDDAPTGLIVKTSTGPGTTNVDYHRMASAGSRLAEGDIPVDAFVDADLLHLTGITAVLSESSRSALREAIRLARQHGMMVSYDVNHRSRLARASGAEAIHRELVSLADIVFASDSEVPLLTEDRGLEDAMRSIGRMGPAAVVITRGADGASALADGRVRHQPAVPTEVVDTVGAGDAFVAGYLADRLAGRSTPEALLTGTLTGAAVCGNRGDWEGAVTREQLRRVSDADPVER